MSATEITKDNFESNVLNSKKTVLLDFWADWCMPCRRLSPVIEEIAEENPEIFVGKINVDEQPELAARFSVMSIPSLFVFKNGEVTNRSVGVIPKAEILELLK